MRQQAPHTVYGPQYPFAYKRSDNERLRNVPTRRHVPGLFPLQEGTRLELVFPELKDPTLGVGRRGREECEFLAELGLARVEIRDHLPVRILILRAGTMSELVSTARC